MERASVERSEGRRGRSAHRWARRTVAFGLALVAAGCSALPPEDSPAVEAAARDVAVLLGQRSLDSDWEPNDDQLLIGVDFAWTPPGAWVELDTGFLYSFDGSDVDVGAETFDADAQLFEFFVGVRKSFPLEGLRLTPYVGGGASLLYADFEGVAGGAFEEEEEVALGGYAKAGLLFRLTRETAVGVELRGLAAQEIDVAGDDVSLDAVHAVFVFSASY